MTLNSLWRASRRHSVDLGRIQETYRVLQEVQHITNCGRTIIRLFRFYLDFDNFNEECNALELQRKKVDQEQKEEIEEKIREGKKYMEIEEL